MSRFTPTHVEPPPKASLVRNRLLAALAPEDSARLRPYPELSIPSLGDVPAELGRHKDYVFFPEAGIEPVLVASVDNQDRKSVV